jgi:hypothetical protein
MNKNSRSCWHAAGYCDIAIFTSNLPPPDNPTRLVVFDTVTQQNHARLNLGSTRIKLAPLLLMLCACLLRVCSVSLSLKFGSPQTAHSVLSLAQSQSPVSEPSPLLACMPPLPKAWSWSTRQSYRGEGGSGPLQRLHMNKYKFKRYSQLLAPDKLHGCIACAWNLVLIDNICFTAYGTIERLEVLTVNYNVVKLLLLFLFTALSALIWGLCRPLQ